MNVKAYSVQLLVLLRSGMYSFNTVLLDVPTVRWLM